MVCFLFGSQNVGVTPCPYVDVRVQPHERLGVLLFPRIHDIVSLPSLGVVVFIQKKIFVSVGPKDLWESRDSVDK